MAQFLCKVGTPTGEIVERVYSATDEGSLRAQLGGEDMLVLSMRRQGILGSMVPRLGFSRRFFRLFGRFVAAVAGRQDGDHQDGDDQD